jgi:lipopolysaccharide/colanic/teichoic acid biosynthesis glycosyltransferase
VGGLLRKCRLDELPQVWNVLRGDMSFIGPRPERPYFVDLLKNKIPYYDLRHYVKPGITGWAQVMYRYGASIEDSYRKLQYDLYYAKNISLQLDLLILLKTIKVVASGQGR